MTIYQLTCHRMTCEADGCGEELGRPDVELYDDGEAARQAFEAAVKAAPQRVTGYMQGSRRLWDTTVIMLFAYDIEDADIAKKFLEGDITNLNRAGSDYREEQLDRWESESV